MTRRVALIGKPLKRRHSQVMHDAAFQAYGIDARYELLELDPHDLGPFTEQARDDSWLGLQVTAPYKRDVFALLDDVEPEARAIGAVNSVARGDDGSLVGFNTDAPGFADAAQRELKLRFDDAAVVVAGAGGAARAVVHESLARGAREVVVASRRPEQARELVDAVDGPARAARLGEPACVDALAAADLFVNATTVGMLSPGTPVDPDTLGRHTAVFDLVYVPAQTELVTRARSRGRRACPGAAVLGAQAAIAFRRWTAVEDASPVMREALAPLLAESTAA
jgi:shikimate dehydrogenase